jgi:hypothetical protein
MLTRTCEVTVPVTASVAAAADDAASAVAIETTPHSMMSSSTAEPSSRLAKRVWRMPRSLKILVMTGIDVTAVALQISRMSAGRLPELPIRSSSGSSDAMPSVRKNGSGVPMPRIHAVGLRFSRPSTFRTAAPDTNIRSSRPRL